MSEPFKTHQEMFGHLVAGGKIQSVGVPNVVVGLDSEGYCVDQNGTIYAPSTPKCWKPYHKPVKIERIIYLKEHATDGSASLFGAGNSWDDRETASCKLKYKITIEEVVE